MTWTSVVLTFGRAGLAVALVASGCFYAPDLGSGATPVASSGESTTTGPAFTTTAADDPPTTSPTASTSIADQTTTSSSAATTSSSAGEPDTDADDSSPSTPCQDPVGQPHSSQCSDTSGCGCGSGKCYVIPILGGFCGDCLDDSECEPGGCTLPNPLAGTGSSCNKGKAGNGCMSDKACLQTGDQLCAPVLDVPGIFTVSTCGECKTNADCANPSLPNCTPTYNFQGFSGRNVCAASGSVPQDGGCSLTDDGGGQPLGDAACMSGRCGEINVMGLLKLGICGECRGQADCSMRQTCVEPVADLASGVVHGSVCM